MEDGGHLGASLDVLYDLIPKVGVTAPGESVVTFEDPSSGFSALPNPFREGENRVTVTFSRRDGETRASSLSLLLSTARVGSPDPDDVSIDTFEVDEESVEIDISIEIKGGIPTRYRKRERAWNDRERTHLLLESIWTTENMSDPEADHRAENREWSESGDLVLETAHENGRLMEAQYFKPDGSLGARIEEGHGFRREWIEGGVLVLEVPYLNGLEHGERKEFYDSGNLATTISLREGVEHGPFEWRHESGAVGVTGRFVEGRKEGIWILYGEDGEEETRSTFRADELVEGTHRFEF